MNTTAPVQILGRDVITGRDYYLTDRFMLCPKPGQLAIGEESQATPAYEPIVDGSVICWRDQVRPGATAFHPDQLGSHVAALPRLLLAELHYELMLRGQLYGRQAKEICFNCGAMRRFVERFGADQATQFYLSRAATEAWALLLALPSEQ
ncbi:hypothetical protein JNJ66_07530 [Candidatus Saccharibacteria bacterium]|nr:hypothetical protein [Candidatus Saccharibacteria bacterium]